MNPVTDALALANAVHAGQIDKAGEPYMRHILRVWAAAKSRNLGVLAEVVAILHDTLEDDTSGAINYVLLKNLFGVEVAEAVAILTRNKDEDYISSYIARVKTNSLAIKIKLLDIEDHLNRIYKDMHDDLGIKWKKSRRERYEQASKILLETV